MTTYCTACHRPCDTVLTDVGDAEPVVLSVCCGAQVTRFEMTDDEIDERAIHLPARHAYFATGND